MSTNPEVFSLVRGEVRFWIGEESSVMLSAAGSFGDPVELTRDEAVALGRALLEAAEQLH